MPPSPLPVAEQAGATDPRVWWCFLAVMAVIGVAEWFRRRRDRP